MNRSAKYIFTLLIASTLVIAAGCNQTNTGHDATPAANTTTTQAQQNSISYNTPLTVGSTNILVAVMRTEAELQRGLSGQLSLQNNQGMLFVFDREFAPSFWMKDMNFDLDLVWIRDNKIVGITSNVPAPKKNTPDSELPTYSPNQNIDTVLEVNSGWTSEHNVNVGDVIKL